jgi:hypothetical protein
MFKIILTQKEYLKNPNTKTTYLLNCEESREITEKEFFNMTNADTLKFFRRLGGTESAIFGYTCNGYKVTKLTSTSPDKQIKIVRTFKFIYNN